MSQLWLCPHLESPNVDMGYDISDYERIQPVYGDMNDMQMLIDDVSLLRLSGPVLAINSLY